MYLYSFFKKKKLNRGAQGRTERSEKATMHNNGRMQQISIYCMCVYLKFDSDTFIHPSEQTHGNKVFLMMFLQQATASLLLAHLSVLFNQS